MRYQIYNSDYDLSSVFPEKPSQLAELDEEIEYTKALASRVREGVVRRGSTKSKELLKKIDELLTDEKIREMQGVCDEEARTGHKSADDRFFGYKNHIAMNEERIITAVKITDGSADDGKQLPDLIAQSRENGVVVDEVIADTAYCREDTLTAAGDEENGYTLVSKVHPCVAEAHSKELEGFTYNKDADTYVCMAGHCAMSCTKRKAKKSGNTVYLYNFSKVTCKKCPLKDECKISKKSHSFSITIPKQIHQDQLDFSKTDHFKERYRQRYKIEAKNSEAKNCHGLDTADSKGIHAMNVQSYLTAFVLNIKRIFKLQILKTQNRG